jgi:hypothetical protein
MRTVKTGIYDLNATGSFTVKVGSSAITMLPDSVTIAATKPIVLMGGAMVMGDLVVTGDATAKSVASNTFVTALEQVKGASMSCGALTATEANLTTPYVPPALSTLLVEYGLTVAGIIALQDAMEAVKVGLKEVNDAVQQPLEDISPMSPEAMNMYI